jgi:hypothetical protein
MRLLCAFYVPFLLDYCRFVVLLSLRPTYRKYCKTKSPARLRGFLPRKDIGTLLFYHTSKSLSSVLKKKRRKFLIFGFVLEAWLGDLKIDYNF